MKGKDIGHVSVKVPKLLQLLSIYSDENNAMSYLSNTGEQLRSRVNGGCSVYCMKTDNECMM